MPEVTFLVAVRVAITPTAATPLPSSFLLSGTIHIMQIIQYTTNGFEIHSVLKKTD